VLWKQTVKI